MNKKLLTLACSLACTVAFAAPFQPNSLLIYRVGDGSAALTNGATAVFIDEYSVSAALPPVATLLQSVPLPVVAAGAQQSCVAAGTSTSEGLITRSTDGQYVLITCYGAPLPTAAVAGTAAATIPRVIARVAPDGSIDTSTALSDFADTQSPRSAVSVDGSAFWATGGSGGANPNGVRYATFGATTSTQVSNTITNLRQIGIFNGGLFVSHASGTNIRIQQVGTGLPTTAGTAMIGLPGIPTTGSPHGFFFADLTDTVAGDDTLYMALDGAVGAGVAKFSLVAGSWVANGVVSVTVSPIGLLSNPRAMVGAAVPGQGVFFATIANSASVFVGIDSSGYNVNSNAQLVSILSAGTNQALRGLTRSPEVAVPVWVRFADGFE